jgi:surface protein
MKSFKQHIFEKLKVSSNKEGIDYTLFPKTKEELINMIKDEISNNGNECSLNHIDVNEITDMSFVFSEFVNFVGDISNWDVSNVTNMHSMFAHSKFDGDISNWNVSNVTNMAYMFAFSNFNGDISEWNVSNVTNMSYMFTYSNFDGDISNWNVLNVKNMKGTFNNCQLKVNKRLPKWYKQ